MNTNTVPILIPTEGLRFGPFFHPNGWREWILTDWPDWERDVGADPGRMISRGTCRLGNFQVWIWSTPDVREAVHVVFLDDSLSRVRTVSVEPGESASRLPILSVCTLHVSDLPSGHGFRRLRDLPAQPGGLG